MEDVVMFVARHGDWQYSRSVHPPEALCPFLLRVSAVVNERVDALLPAYFGGFDALHTALDSIVSSGKPLSKQLSSAVRGKKAREAWSSILESIVSEYSLDKKPAAAFKDILKIYSTRYILRANDRLWELGDDVGDAVDAPADGYQFIAKYGNWIVVKKQKISPKTRPVDVILYLSSVSSSIYNGYSAFCQKEPLAIAIDDLPSRSASLDKDSLMRILAGFYELLQRSKFPAHYGPAYDNIKPPKRIRGVKTK